MFYRTFLLLVFSLGSVLAGYAQSPRTSGCEALSGATNCRLLADFEDEAAGEIPDEWRTSKDEELVPLTRTMNSHQNVYVREDDGNHFARVHTKGKAFRVVKSYKQGLDWHVRKRPYLRWSWRAQALPEGANEKYDDTNDTGGAVYVTFDTDWLGRPVSIKYTYSSSLPVGTTVDYGSLMVLVVASKQNHQLGEWITHERNVVEDYRDLFGERPDKTPLAFMMWSDSNTVDGVGTIDFDNIMLLSEPSTPRSTTVSADD